MITPSALNVVIIGLSVIIFAFLWRMLAGWFTNQSSSPEIGEAMAVVL